MIARTLEEEGISTICITFREDVMELTRPPRIVSVKTGPGKPLGNPGDRKKQRKIIEAGFKMLGQDINEMTIVSV